MLQRQQQASYWAILQAISENRKLFSEGQSIVAAATMLLVRNKLLDDIRTIRELQELSAVVGVSFVVEVASEFASYEVLRILRKLIAPVALEKIQTPEQARDLLLACIRATSFEAFELASDGANQNVGPKEAPAAPIRTLGRHNAFAARRGRDASAPG